MSKITQAARDQSCIRCGARNGTVVAAHINGPIASKLGRGMAQKPSDIFCAHLCHSCHDQADRRDGGDGFTDEEWMELVLLTIARLAREGVI